MSDDDFLANILNIQKSLTNAASIFDCFNNNAPSKTEWEAWVDAQALAHRTEAIAEGGQCPLCREPFSYHTPEALAVCEAEHDA